MRTNFTHRCTGLALTTSLLLLTAQASSAALGKQNNANDIHGLWVDNKDVDKQKVAIQIEDCGTSLCGRIYWLKKPFNKEGQPKHDKHNSNSTLRNRPLCGLQILSGFRYSKDNTWGDGQIYNPDDGYTFKSTMSLKEDGTLNVRGYVGISLLGKTVEWVRPKEKIEQCN